jgi:hypothetical protein
MKTLDEEKLLDEIAVDWITKARKLVGRLVQDVSALQWQTPAVVDPTEVVTPSEQALLMVRDALPRLMRGWRLKPGTPPDWVDPFFPPLPMPPRPLSKFEIAADRLQQIFLGISRGTNVETQIASDRSHINRATWRDGLGPNVLADLQALEVSSAAEVPDIFDRFGAGPRSLWSIQAGIAEMTRELFAILNCTVEKATEAAKETKDQLA